MKGCGIVNTVPTSALPAAFSMAEMKVFDCDDLSEPDVKSIFEIRRRAFKQESVAQPGQLLVESPLFLSNLCSTLCRDDHANWGQYLDFDRAFEYAGAQCVVKLRFNDRQRFP